MTLIPSEMDVGHLAIIRQNVDKMIRRWADVYDRSGAVLLDIAPQVYQGARQFWKKASIKTLDLDPSTQPDYIADLCKPTGIADNLFDYILCTEVLEHTMQPFRAVAEMHRLLAPDGRIMVTTPFNFRIHGPLPDCWRFTEHGLRSLFSEGFKDIVIEEIATPGRPLMPIHYALTATKS